MQRWLKEYHAVHPTMPSINTNITISAPPSAVRKVFLDFPTYPEWNPFLTSMESSTETPERGTQLRVVGGGQVFKPKVIENTPERFSWIGELFGSWFLSGNHIFEFEPFGEVGANGETEGCKLVHKENFSGILAGLLLFLLGKKTEKGFKDMNVALKARVEQAPTA
jgi:hypothetical protein